MGKIRIKTLGIEEEEELRKKEKERREQKKLRKKLAKLPGMRGGEKIADASVSPEEFEEIEKKAKKETETKKEEAKKIKPEKTEEKPEVIKEEKVPSAPRIRGQKYQNAVKLVDRKKSYPIEEAVKLVKQTSYSKFIGSVEVHINLFEKGVKVSLALPHGTGKERKIAVCDEKILKDLEAGKINFDVLIATPDFMPKLARFAKILGPKGLMPNPKLGTVTKEPQKVVAELQAGRIDLKTESEAPIIHTVIGKVNFEDKKLLENFNKLIEAIGKAKIKSVFIKATMGPSIRVSLA